MEACCIIDRKTGKRACPLQKVEVRALIGDGLAEVTVTQGYINSGCSSIEALYTFPLPHKAQVTGFSARIGENEITGELKEKEEAFREYDTAVRRGDSAVLLESHRPDIFQLSLGNLASGESACVTVSYLQETELTDNELRWVFPTLVAPRYIPGDKSGRKSGPGSAAPTDKVPDADYITPPVGDAPYALRLQAVLTLSSKIKKVSSPSHPLEILMEKERVVVSLSRESELLDSDFILAASLENESDTALVTAAYEEFGSFALLRFVPDIEEGPVLKKGWDYTFLIDVSGSMAGEKLEQAKRALSIALRNITSCDSFNIIAFESDFRCFSGKPVPYSQMTLDSADRWIGSLTDMGGTEIYKPLDFALNKYHVPDGFGRVILLFTDGQVGNEREVINLVRNHSCSLSLFPFGIDTSVNKFFIDSLAEAGNGMPEYIYPGERIEDKVIRQFARIHQPYIERAAIEGSCGKELEVLPGLPARLYGIENYNFIARVDDLKQIDGGLVLRGIAGKEEFRQQIKISGSGNGKLMALKWAKEKILMLESQLGGGNDRRNELIGKEILDISIRFGLVSTLTSFVAVHKRLIKETGLPETVIIPVSKPRGWDMFESPAACYSMAAPSRAIKNAVFESCDMDSIDMPAFLRSRSSRRTGMSKAISPRSVMSSPVKNQARHMAPGQAASNNMDEAGEAVRMAAERQNADGTFGKGSEVNRKTSFFIIGLLSLHDGWKPYRIQILKAATALMKTNEEHALLKATALFMVFNAGIYKGGDMKEMINGIAGSFTGLERKIFEELGNGDSAGIFKFMAGIIMEQGDKKEAAVHLLKMAVK